MKTFVCPKMKIVTNTAIVSDSGAAGAAAAADATASHHGHRCPFATALPRTMDMN